MWYAPLRLFDSNDVGRSDLFVPEVRPECHRRPDLGGEDNQREEHGCQNE